MAFWKNISSHFPFVVTENRQDKNTLLVSRRDVPIAERGNIETVEPWVKANLERARIILTVLRTARNPTIQFINNLFLDIQRSGGKAHVIGQILEEDEVFGQKYDVVQFADEAIANQIANCDRAAPTAIAEALKPKYNFTDPIVMYWDASGRHTVPIIGDSRMEKYKPEHTVVMDPYYNFPMPYTMKYASQPIQLPRKGEAGFEDVEIWNAGESFDRNRITRRTTIRPVTDEQAVSWLSQVRWPAAYGPTLVQTWVKNEKLETGKMPNRWQHLFGTTNPSIRFDCGDGQGATAYNDFPIHFVKQRTDGFQKIGKMYPEHAGQRRNRDEEDSNEVEQELHVGRLRNRMLDVEPANKSRRSGRGENASSSGTRRSVRIQGKQRRLEIEDSNDNTVTIKK